MFYYFQKISTLTPWKVIGIFEGVGITNLKNMKLNYLKFPGEKGKDIFWKQTFNHQ